MLKPYMSSKYVKIHGMSDESWTIKDKLSQYRGILRLHARDKSLQETNAKKSKKKVGRDLKTLYRDVKEYREIIKTTCGGDMKQINVMLLLHKDLQLLVHRADPEEAFEKIFQEFSLKVRTLDKLQYQKVQLMKKYYDLELDVADLKEVYRKQLEEGPDDQQQQRLVQQYQRAVARQSAATAIKNTYILILNILKKDAIYFDVVLDALRHDQKDQCRVMVRATVKGQLATENLDDCRKVYKTMTYQVLVNMKERERTLQIARQEVEELKDSTKLLVRIESDTDFVTNKKNNESNTEHLEKHVKGLEKIVDKITSSILVRSYEELLPTLEEQMRQKERLNQRFDENIKERDILLRKKEHAVLLLDSIEHTSDSSTVHFESEKKAMLEEIEAEKKRENDFVSLQKDRGALLVKVRGSLHNILGMVSCIREAREMRELKRRKEAEARKLRKLAASPIDEEMIDEDDDQIVENFSDDVTELLADVHKRVQFLANISNFILEVDKEERARDMYQSYISDHRSNMKFSKETEEQPTFLVEHETIDHSVMTRQDVKLKSKLIVEANTKQD